MPSFDIVSQIDYQEVLNAVDGVKREIGNRYDFKNVKWSIEFDKKEKTITIIGDSDYCLNQIQNSINTYFVRRKLDPKSLDFPEPEKTGGNSLRQVIKIKEGIEQEIAKKITKAIKESKMKVQASIQGVELRVSGKSKNDLQTIIQLVKDLNLPLPLQFINFRD